LVAALAEGLAQARDALANTTEEHLQKPWRLLVSGRVVSEERREIAVRDTFMHLSHHRGQPDSLFTPERRAGAGHLWSVWRRRAIRLGAFGGSIQESGK
jgi:hypothetical protein